MANPYVFLYPNHTTSIFAPGFQTDLAYLEDESNWPEWTPQRQELYSDTIGVMTATIILQSDLTGPFLMQGTFDFETNAVNWLRG